MGFVAVGGDEWGGVQGVGIGAEGRGGGEELAAEFRGEAVIGGGEVEAGGGFGAVHGAGDVELVEVIDAAEDPGFERLMGEGEGGGEGGRGGGGVEDAFDAGEDDLCGFGEVAGILDDEAIQEWGLE